MGKEVFAFVRLLITKGIAFCVYRYPDTENIKLAISEELRPQANHKTFWIAPFTGQTSTQELILSVFENDVDLQEYSMILNNLPDKVVLSHDLPNETDKSSYIEQFEKIKQNIYAGYISKAILSRVKKVKRPIDFDEVSFFETLCNGYKNAFTYLFYHPVAGMWAGATPELLINKYGDMIQIMAVAGTQPIKEGVYIWRPKEDEEHAIVGRHIEAVCEKYRCSLNEKKGPYTVEAGRVAHLRTDYTFENVASIPLKSFIFDLHPTPAIGGFPIKKSVEMILDIEPYDRKYYCGFLGETDFEKEAKLFVNLRCMQIGQKSIALYSGGGITADSDVEEEWVETEMKIRTMADKLITA